MSSSGESLGRELTLLDGDWTPPQACPKRPKHKREHFETMLFAIRLQFGQQRSLVT